MENYIYGEYLSFDYRVRIQKFLNKLNTYNEEEKKELILKLYKSILKFETQGNADNYIAAINFLKLKIVREYFE